MTNHTVPGKEKIVFAISEERKGTIPTVVMGMSRASWEYMKNGLCHTFDLTAAGVPVKIILFGGETQEDCLRLISPNLDQGTIDARTVDFSIKDEGEPN